LWLIFLQGNEVYFDVKKVNADALSTQSYLSAMLRIELIGFVRGVRG
jgi:hypothetical protein